MPHIIYQDLQIMERLMREHVIRCQIENGISAEYIRTKMNFCTVSHIKRILCENGFSKEEQIRIVAALIEYVKQSES